MDAVIERRRRIGWKSVSHRLRRPLAGADKAVEAILQGGMERWEKDGILEPSQAASLRAQLSSGQVQDALHHLGVHIVLSAPIPIPGLQNLARLVWTLAFWFVIQVRRIRRQEGNSVENISNIHGPLVMALSLLPVLGSFAYLVARPLRNKLLMRLILDQVAWKLPMGFYSRLRLGRLLPPTPLSSELNDAVAPKW